MSVIRDLLAIARGFWTLFRYRKFFRGWLRRQKDFAEMAQAREAERKDRILNPHKYRCE